ncbi:MAG: HD domain-containing protein [Solirubrobacteraceae bacterium]
MSAGLSAARAALVGRRAWLVGGVVRDELLGRPSADDFDIIVEGDVELAARAVAREARAAVFELSGDWGSWRVSARDGAWQVDLSPLRGGTLVEDLAARDFTVNAIARELGGGAQLIDPLSGAEDLQRGILRLAAPDALSSDPVRALRLVRFCCQLDMSASPEASRAARLAAPGLARVAPERVFAELCSTITSARAVQGVRMLGELNLSAVVLPELDALAGVAQNRFHHLDVHGHTLEVLDRVIRLEAEPAEVIGGQHAEQVSAVLAQPLADGLTRGGALRFGALLHDVAKPLTRTQLAAGRVGFPAHDERGADVSRQVLGRLRASERLRGHVAALARHHLRLGFLVHHAPLGRRAIYAYLDACEPVAVDVTLLSCADRLATRGADAERSIARHLELARELIGPALHWQAAGRPSPLLRGDALAAAVGIPPGPRLGDLLAQLEEAQFAGEITNREQAVEYARALIA